MTQFEHGDEVQWLENLAKPDKVCTGTIINEERYCNGSNPYGFWCIRVHDAHWKQACHTAREMSSQWVTRSVTFNKLKKTK